MSAELTTEQTAHLLEQVKQITPLQEIEMTVTERYSEPGLETIAGVATSVDFAVLPKYDSLQLEGLTDSVRDPYTRFYVGLYYNPENTTIETRHVNALFYNDSGDRVTMNIGNLANIELGDPLTREQAYGN